MADAEKAVNEKGVLTDNADSSAYTKVYEASAVSDLSCDLKYEELVLKTWNEAKVQVKVTGKDHNRVKISNDNGSLTIASSQKVRNRSVEIFCPENLSLQKIKDLFLLGLSFPFQNFQKLLFPDRHFFVVYRKKKQEREIQKFQKKKILYIKKPYSIIKKFIRKGRKI